ncbi:MAG: DNA repair protein RadC [Candidatus Dojkabacteria bacterium]|nr:DNA repair protein RadC [Candidatus Dojkabacteria bacterium]
MFPREKFLTKGIDNLSDMDLVAIIVGRGIKGKNFLSVSKSVINKMRKVVVRGDSIDINDINCVDGIGTVTAMRILAGIELGKRIYDLGTKERYVVRNSGEAYEILKDIAKKKQEHIVALFLNSRFEVLERRVICIGSLDGVSILPRDIIIPALELNANSIVMAHNHPSGDAMPSTEDEDITKRIKEGLELVGLNLLDHIVIGDNQWQRVDF